MTSDQSELPNSPIERVLDGTRVGFRKRKKDRPKWQLEPIPSKSTPKFAKRGNFAPGESQRFWPRQMPHRAKVTGDNAPMRL